MADQKISQLTDGGNAQAADEFVVARSGSNFRIDGASVAAAATSVGTLTSLSISGQISSTAGAVISGSGASTSARYVVLSTTGGDFYTGIESSAGGSLLSGSSAYARIFGTSAAYPLEFFTNNVKRATIDASGNLGLGVTPSAWSVLTPAMQMGTAGSFIASQGSTAAIYIGTNAFFDGTNWKYVINGAASRYLQNAGAHSWFTAASGTAGNNISFTQAMTLDASGNLGVGVASPATAGGRDVDISAGASKAATLWLHGNNTSGASQGFQLQSGTDATAYAWNFANAPLVFATNNTERARITSGGYFKASNDGTYYNASTSQHELRNNVSGTEIAYLTQTHNSAPYGVRIGYTAASPNNTGYWFLYCDDSTALRAEIRSNGGLANYQANDVNLSDERVKTDIKPAGSYWDKFKAIEIVTFKYVDQTHDDDNIGVIAQQVEAVAPEFIDVDGFGETPEGEEPLKTVYTTDMYHAAIKALQEAMARIEALEVEVAALKANA